MPSQTLLSGMGSVPVSAYRISMGVDVLEPRMILRMDLVATSSFKRLDLLVDPYAISPQSMRLRTRLLQRVHRLLCDGAQEAFAIIEKTFFMRMHLFMIICICSFHNSLASNMMPRNFAFELFGMRWPLRKSRGSSPGLQSLVKDTAEDLGAENLNFHFRPHLTTLSIYGWRITSASAGSLVSVYMVTSSAKRRCLTSGGGLGKSDSIRLKRRGLITAPCGTPFFIILDSEMQLPSLMQIERFCRKLDSHPRQVPWIQILVSLYSKPLIQTVSQALLMSRKTATVDFLSLKLAFISWSSRITWSVCDG